MEQTTHNIESGDKGSAWLSGVGLAAAFAALVGASCCVLPILLASVGVGGAWIAQLGVFVAYQTYFAAGAIALIAAGWLVATLRRSRRRTFIVLGLSTIVVAVALILPTFESEITRTVLALVRG